jgi:hypothetical protein
MDGRKDEEEAGNVGSEHESMSFESDIEDGDCEDNGEDE